MTPMYDTKNLSIIKEIFENAMEREISDQDYGLNFENLDIPSLKMVVILIKIESLLGIEINAEQVALVRQGTLGEFMEAIQRFSEEGL